jgi:CotH kinase protein/Chitobiase/beta-hexosaminidase C-terminal domain
MLALNRLTALPLFLTLWAGAALTAPGCADSASEDTNDDGPAKPEGKDEVAPASVSISQPSQTFEGMLRVELVTDVASAQVRFTTDGSIPSATSTLYDGMALELAETTQLRAQAFVEGQAQGSAVTALFIERSFDPESNLPLLVLDGYGAGTPPDNQNYRDVAFMAFEPSAGRTTLSQLPRVASRAGWHLRGQSSASFEQTPYRLELWDEHNEDAEYPVLGMPAEADWALIGPYVDRSLIRNALSYDLGTAMGLQGPRYAFAEVYINPDGGPLGPEHYEGIYMLTETIKNDKNRLNLQQLQADESTLPELSGGYIFKFDWAAVEAGAPTLTCSGSTPISMGGGLGGGGLGGGGFGGGGAQTPGTCWGDLEVVDPKDINAEQSAWLTDYLQRFHDSLHTDPPTNYGEFINLDSFVDTFLLNEFTRNMDAFVRSLYFYKDRDGALTAGPLWDFNLTFACGGSFGNTETTGWQFQQRMGSNDWFHRLATDPAFMDTVATRWKKLRKGPFATSEIDARIDALQAQIGAAVSRDFERWPPATLRTSFFTFPEGETWDEQVQAIRDWMAARAEWLDDAVSQPIPTTEP